MVTMKRIDDVKDFFSNIPIHDAYITSANICEGKCELVIHLNPEEEYVPPMFRLEFRGLDRILLDLEWNDDVIISGVRVQPRYKTEKWNLNIELTNGGGRLWGVCPSLNVSFAEMYFSDDG